MTNKLFLIDGHALVFKMYYAFVGHPMVNTKGVDTSILFGFTKYLLELIEKEQPQYIAVSFDPPGGTFRNQLYPEYKANRRETPQLVIDALEPLTRILKALRIPVLMMPGYEADDVIGSAAKRFASKDLNVYMVTPDKDYGQLINENIFQFRPGKSGADNELLGIKEVCDKWKISSPSQVIDILAICGDNADNVPGVQGVGPVGASKLLGKYGTLEGIYQHLEALTARQQELFVAAESHIQLSKQLVTIKTDISLDITREDMLLKVSYNSDFQAIANEFEFPSLIRLVKRIAPLGQAELFPSAEPISSDIQTVDKLSPEDFIKLQALRQGILLKNRLVYLSTDRYWTCANIETFRSILEDKNITKVGVGLKSTIHSLSDFGIELAGKLEDIELMHYLVNPERSHKLEYLAQTYLGLDLEDQEAELQTASLFDELKEPEEVDKSKEVSVLLPLADKLKQNLIAQNAWELYENIEEPLIGVLSRMENAGVKIDLSSLRDYIDELRKAMLEQEAIVRDIAGDPNLNLSSPKQIGVLVFEKLKLDPKAKKPKNGNWSTDEATLSALADVHPVIDAILEYRGLRKLLSTYIEPIPGYISPRDARVHTTFNQALTSTGRLSSSNPNLQNIPIRTDKGRVLRKAFMAEGENSVMMSADYSQIELRIMAHLCGDEHLIEAFRQGLDVHSATAAKIFGLEIDEVTAEQRRIAKTANFGIMYGISAFGLSQRLKCPRSEAKRIIDDYFESFPSIRAFIDTTIADARDKGYVTTLYGRRRYIADINSNIANMRALAERNAVNAPIQGTAADIIKLAMIRVDERLRQLGLKSKMVLQIHDELLLEVPNNEIDTVQALLKDCMENVISLSIPLSVECNYGKNWLDAH